jgi:hypothetical protein
LDDLTSRKIVKFRQKHDDERREFVSEVELLAQDLRFRSYGNDEEFQQYLRESAASIDRKRRNLVASMRSSGIETRLKASAISAEVAIGGSSSTGPLDIGASVSVGLGTSAVLYGFRQQRRADFAKDAAASYLFLLSQQLDVRDYLSRLAAMLRLDRR